MLGLDVMLDAEERRQKRQPSDDCRRSISQTRMSRQGRGGFPSTQSLLLSRWLVVWTVRDVSAIANNPGLVEAVTSANRQYKQLDDQAIRSKQEAVLLLCRPVNRRVPSLAAAPVRRAPR